MFCNKIAFTFMVGLIPMVDIPMVDPIPMEPHSEPIVDFTPIIAISIWH